MLDEHVMNEYYELVKEKDKATTIKLFVYGTLKSGFYNNTLLDQVGGTKLYNAILKDMKLVDLGSFPGMVESEGDVVLGEIWEIESGAISIFDKLEGHPLLYQRISATAETLEDSKSTQEIDVTTYLYAGGLRSTYKSSEYAGVVAVYPDYELETSVYGWVYPLIKPVVDDE